MPRRGRRSGISFIEDDKDRSITFFKRRSGLHKAAADMSALTGARIAVVAESENGKMSAFGTPSANPIIDSFLLGNAPPLVNEEQMERISHMQNDLFKLEKDKVVEDKRRRLSMTRKKEVQETSRLAKLIYGDEKDLDLDEVNDLLHGLSRVQQDINSQLHTLHPGYQLEIDRARDPSLQLSSSRPHSQIQLSPRRFSCTPLQPSSDLPRSSWLLPSSSRLQSSLLNPVMLPSPQTRLLQHQAHKMKLPNESHQYNNHFSQYFSRSTLLPSQPPPLAIAPTSSSHIPLSNDFPPLSPPLQLPQPMPSQVELPFGAQNFNPVAPPQNHSNTHNFAVGNPFATYQPPIIPSNEPYHDPSLHGLNVSLGNKGYCGGQAADGDDMPGPFGLCNDYYGGQAVGGHDMPGPSGLHSDYYGGQAASGHDMPGPSGLHQQPYDWLKTILFESSSDGESSSG
ncbi:uncharacterized protein LOC133891202 [Phragmites australis]|uniref:uncharacterized protein LOC133891202 n=1 Tax=Phragmites australis TaxID=29695 RepID=UPI002D78A2F7|nr:uncharacterized protein LOC133891202 [Phragmites australis]